MATRKARWRLAAALGIVAAFATDHAHAQSVALEADALAYPLGGYSAAIRITQENGFSYALGTGRYTLPSFIVKGQATYDAAGWSATSEAIQVLRVGYRLRGPHQDGPAADVIVLNQLWKLTAERLGASTHFKSLGVGVAGGYYFHIGSHFYLYPNGAVTYERVYSGDPQVSGLDYEVSPLGLTGSVHLGWEY
jgi:hypothetical protein